MASEDLKSIIGNLCTQWFKIYTDSRHRALVNVVLRRSMTSLFALQNKADIRDKANVFWDSVIRKGIFFCSGIKRKLITDKRYPLVCSRMNTYKIYDLIFRVPKNPDQISSLWYSWLWIKTYIRDAVLDLIRTSFAEQLYEIRYSWCYRNHGVESLSMLLLNQWLSYYWACWYITWRWHISMKLFEYAKAL